MRLIVAVPALVLFMLLLSCDGDSEPATLNQFVNPGFEEGSTPWFSLTPPDFIVSDEVAHSGRASALLELRANTPEDGTKISYLVQEIQPEEFPEVISGSYRVEKWVRGTEKQYLQVAVIAFGAPNLPGDFANHQIRYILAGIEEKPLSIGNAHFVFLGNGGPSLGEWGEFQGTVREDFRRLWGAVPEDYEKIRVLFEVRYDDKAHGEGPVEADVYYDDLYSGPAP